MRAVDLLAYIWHVANKSLGGSRLVENVLVRSYFAWKRLYEDPVHMLIQEKPEVFQGGHIIDVGAFLGYTAFEFAHVVTPGFKVWAVEPDPKSYAILCRQIETSGFDRTIVPIPIALGNRGWKY